MTEDNTNHTKEKFEVAVQIRNFEIELFWKRSLFFWGFISAAFIGYAALRKDHSDLSAVITCFGMVCSLAWTLLNRGSKYWQESWETKVERYESGFIGNYFSIVEDVQSKGIWLSARKYSVSKLSIALSDYVFLLWLFLMASEMFRIFYPICALHLKHVGILGFVSISVLYLFLLSIFGRKSPRK